MRLGSSARVRGCPSRDFAGLEALVSVSECAIPALARETHSLSSSEESHSAGHAPLERADTLAAMALESCEDVTNRRANAEDSRFRAESAVGDALVVATARTNLQA